MKKRFKLLSPEGFQRLPAWQVRTGISVVLLVAFVNAVRVAFHFGYNQASFNILDGNHIDCCASFVDPFLVVISLSLVTSAAGMWSRKKKGWALSFVTLLVALLSYFAWYSSTRSIMRKSDVENFAQLPDQNQHLLTLINATWWDVIVLGIILLLIVWHITTLKPFYKIPQLKRADDKSNNKEREPSWLSFKVFNYSTGKSGRSSTWESGF